MYRKKRKIQIYFNGHEHSSINVVEEDSLDFSVPWLSAVLGMEFYWDEEERVVVYTSEDSVVYMGEEFSYIQSSLEPIWKNTIPYIPLHLLEILYDGRIEWNSEQKTFFIYPPGNPPSTATVVSRSRLFVNPNRQFKSINWVQKNDLVEYFEEENGWIKIRTPNGLVGWICNRKLNKIPQELNLHQNGENIESRNYLLDSDEKIIFTWQYIYNVTPNPNDLYVVKDLDVISPTWVSLKNTTGDLIDRGRIDYCEWAHQNGYQVWISFNNHFDLELTHAVLSSSFLRKRVIDQCVQLVVDYKADGINLDWENIYLKDRDLYTQFLRELYPVCKENSLVLSVDITTESTSENWSLCYDRKAIARYCDFIILMAYDQYWAGGKNSGSVAEYGWVEKGIQDLLKHVPGNKVILGIPFYSRLWVQENKENGTSEVHSEAYYMDYSMELAEMYNAKWLPSIRQYYAEWEYGQTMYKLWIDEPRSIKEKLSLVLHYNLRGAAFWRKGYEIPELWSVISETLR